MRIRTSAHRFRLYRKRSIPRSHLPTGTPEQARRSRLAFLMSYPFVLLPAQSDACSSPFMIDKALCRPTRLGSRFSQAPPKRGRHFIHFLDVLLRFLSLSFRPKRNSYQIAWFRGISSAAPGRAVRPTALFVRFFILSERAAAPSCPFPPRPQRPPISHIPLRRDSAGRPCQPLGRSSHRRSSPRAFSPRIRALSSRVISGSPRTCNGAGWSSFSTTSTQALWEKSSVNIGQSLPNKTL